MRRCVHVVVWRSVYAISVPYGVEIWHDHPNTLTQRSLAFSHAFGEARRTEERGLPDIARVAKKSLVAKKKNPHRHREL